MGNYEIRNCLCQYTYIGGLFMRIYVVRARTIGIWLMCGAAGLIIVLAAVKLL